jgi:hypothetical protein
VSGAFLDWPGHLGIYVLLIQFAQKMFATIYAVDLFWYVGSDNLNIFRKIGVSLAK